jgi:hypothetical protein
MPEARLHCAGVIGAAEILLAQSAGRAALGHSGVSLSCHAQRPVRAARAAAGGGRAPGAP